MHSAKHLVHNTITKDKAMMLDLASALNSPVGSLKRKMMSKKMNVLMSAARNRTGEDGQGGIAPVVEPPPGPAEKPQPMSNVLVFHEPPKTKKINYDQPQTPQTDPTQQPQALHPVDERFKDFASSLFLGSPRMPLPSGSIDGQGGQDGQGGEDGQGGWMDSVSSWLKSPQTTVNPTWGTEATQVFKNVVNAGVNTAQSVLADADKNSYTNLIKARNAANAGKPSPASMAVTAATPAFNYGVKAYQNFGPSSNIMGIPVLGAPIIKQAASDIWNHPSQTKQFGPTKPTSASLPSLQSGIDKAFNNDIEEAKAVLRQSNGASWGEIFNHIKATYPNKTNAEIDSSLERDNYFKPGSNNLKEPASTSTGTTEGSAGMSGSAGVGELTGPGGAGTGPQNPNAGTDSGKSDIYSQNVIAEYAGKPQAMFTALFSDRQKLADFAGTTIDKIPENLSPLLSQMIADNTEHLKKETGLDEQRKAIFNRVYSGVNIKDDLTNYVKGKDEYINTIDKQKSAAISWFAGQDTSNPYVAKNVSNYFSYLDGLKASQETRYIDLVNKSVDQYNNTNTQLDLLYQETAKDFNERLATETNVTTEWYNNMKATIGEMYTYVTGAGQRSLDAVEMQVKSTEAARKLLNFALGGGASGSGDLINNWASYSKFIPSENKANDIGESVALPIEFKTDSSGNEIADKNVYIPTWDLASNFADISTKQGSSAGETLTTGSLQTAFANYMTQSLPKLIDVNETSSQKGHNLGTAMKLYTNNIKNLYDSALANKNAAFKQSAVDLTKNLLSKTEEGISNNLINESSKETVISAIKSLISPKKLGLFQGEKPLTSQEIRGRLADWKKSFSSSVNPSILDAIAGYVDSSLSSGVKNPVTLFSKTMGITDPNATVNTLDNLSPYQLARIITYGYARTVPNILPDGIWWQ